MFKRTPPEATELDKVIADLESEMTIRDGDSEDYATMLNRLERLYKLKEKHSPKQWNRDTLLIVGGNLVGIVIIVSYEHAHAVTSKALSFAGKLR